MKKKKESNPVYLAKDKQKFAKQKHGGGGGGKKKRNESGFRSSILQNSKVCRTKKGSWDFLLKTLALVQITYLY